MRQLALIFILLFSISLSASEPPKSTRQQLKEAVTLAWDSMSKMANFGELKNCPPFAWFGDLFSKEEPVKPDPPLTPEQIKECEKLFKKRPEKKKDDVDLSTPYHRKRIMNRIRRMSLPKKVMFARLVRQASKAKSPEDVMLNKLRKIRAEYHGTLEKEIAELDKLIISGELPIKELARRAWRFRRDTGERLKKMTPALSRMGVYGWNFVRYRDPLGPSFEKVWEKAQEVVIRDKEVALSEKSIALESIRGALGRTNKEVDEVLAFDKKVDFPDSFYD